MEIRSLIRPNILTLDRINGLPGNSSAPASIPLDKGESPFNRPQNRYPSPDMEAELVAALADSLHLPPTSVALAGGTDEATDRLLRILCTPQRDNIVITVPSVESYDRLAAINDIECRHAHLDCDFSLPVDKVLGLTNQRTKAILLCSPNVPTGNLLSRDAILKIASRFKGLVVVNEAYIDYARTPSLADDVMQHHNLIVLRTFSKAFASAALRISYILAHPDIIRYLNLIRPSGTLPTHTLTEGLAILRRRFDIDKWTKWQLEEREKVIASVKQLPICVKLYPTDANFFMVKVPDAPALLNYLAEQGIAARNCSAQPQCDNCIAITIGLTIDNNALLGALRKYCEKTTHAHTNP